MTGIKSAVADNKGFTLLEVMIAGGVLTIGILAVLFMYTYAIHGNTQGKRVSEATRIADSKINDLRLKPFDNYEFDAVGAVYTVDNDKYLVKYWNNMTSVVPNLGLKEVRVTVSWSNPNEPKPHVVTINSLTAKQ